MASPLHTHAGHTTHSVYLFTGFTKEDDVGTTPTDRKTQHVNNRAATLNAVDGHDWDTAVRIATEEYDAMTPQQQAEITGPADKPVARPKPARSIKYTRASDVRTETIDWLVDCWIPKASVTLLAGREGIGKSTIAVDWAAQATTGKLTGRAMNVGYVVTEDSRAHTVVPRLKAAGADLNRVMFLDASVPDDQDPELHYDAVLDLPGDFGILRSFIVDQHVGLVILDAAKSVMSAKLDGNSDIAIRQFLEPMHRTAQDTGCTFIGLAHFGKKESADTGRLILGSSAWSQVARSVVSVAADKDTGTVKVWNSKGNLAPRIRTFEAEVVSATVATDDGRDAEVGVIRWGAESDEDGSALLAPDAERDDKDDRTDAEMWLTDYLSGHGEHPKKDVLAAAKKDGLANRTVERAFSKLGGKSEGKGFPRVAHWSLPSLANLANKGGVALHRGGTGGTGADLHKHRGGTGGETTVSPHPTRGGTGGSTATEPARLAIDQGPATSRVHTEVGTLGPSSSEGVFKVPEQSRSRGPEYTRERRDLATVTTLAAANTATDESILAALDTEYPMSPEVIAGSVPGLTKADAPARLEALAAAGKATADNRNRYTRKDPA